MPLIHTYMDLCGVVRLERVFCEVEWRADHSGDEGSTPPQCWGDGLGVFGGQAALQGGKVVTAGLTQQKVGVWHVNKWVSHA